MIPRILELKNFLSYGEPIQKVDFTNHSLICLSGKNGHGKSALLDAMTWAIWGVARKMSAQAKADSGLLRIGTTRMVVSFEFEYNNALYRVRREYAQTFGKPMLLLDFEMFNHDRATFHSLSEKTTRATQDVIDRLLKLDYTTFINSAFLRQGQSNEFSKKSAKERKEVFGSILGLSVYDQLNQKALEKGRLFQEQKKQIQLLCSQYALEIAKEASLGEQQDYLVNQCNALVARIANNAQAIESLEQKLALSVASLNHIALLKQEFQASQDQVVVESAYLKKMFNEWKQWHKFSLSLPDSTLIEREKKDLLEQEKKMRLSQKEYLTFQEKILVYKEQYGHKVRDIEKAFEKQKHETLLDLQKQTIMHDEIQKQIEEKTKRLNEHSFALGGQVLQSLAVLKQQFEKRKIAYQSYVQRANWIVGQRKELEQKIELIAQCKNPVCPLCTQSLSVATKQTLQDDLKKQYAFFSRRIDRFQMLISSLKTILISQHDDLGKQEQRELLSAQIETLNHEISVLKKELACLSQKVREQKQILETLNHSYDTMVKNNPDIQVLFQAIEAIEREQKNISWNDKDAQKLTERINVLEQSLQTYQETQREVQKQHERKLAVQNSCKQLRVLKNREISLLAHISQENSLLQERELITKQKNEILSHSAQLTMQKETLLQHQGKIQQEQLRIAALKTSLQEYDRKNTDLDAMINDYEILAQTFGKNGIQALLIEDALPEIEQQANNLLARLTDNQSHIVIESVRDLKSGGVKETLDIHIADAAGSRPYEMYSGGEAFRVDFALRVAISKLLARRAGAPLQTLIIDEGFGSQDEEGLARIMDALYVLQNDFSKIIVVSHLTEFKHNFPVHFIVEKSATGSVIRVEERG